MELELTKGIPLGSAARAGACERYFELQFYPQPFPTKTSSKSNYLHGCQGGSEHGRCLEGWGRGSGRKQKALDVGSSALTLNP